MRKFAISDIHGCLDSFIALLAKIKYSRQDELFLLGDYIDRGTESKGVFDHIFRLQQDGFKIICLRGNHEQMLLDAFHDSEVELSWLKHGGEDTLASFGVNNINQIPELYLNFIQNLGYYAEVDHYILVHAGLDFRLDDPFIYKEAMLWIRNWYDDMDYGWLNGRVIVHGHTPQGREDTEQQLLFLAQKPAIDIDCGCVYEHTHTRFGLGNLCAFDMTNEQLYFQKYIYL